MMPAIALDANVVEESAIVAVSATPTRASSCPWVVSLTGSARTISTIPPTVSPSIVTWPGIRPSPPSWRRRNSSQFMNSSVITTSAIVASNGSMPGSAA